MDERAKRGNAPERPGRKASKAAGLRFGGAAGADGAIENYDFPAGLSAP